LAQKLLRAGIRWRPNSSAGAPCRWSHRTWRWRAYAGVFLARRSLGKTKVSQSDIVLAIEEYVGRLHISMHSMPAVDVHEGADALKKDVGGSPCPSSVHVVALGELPIPVCYPGLECVLLAEIYLQVESCCVLRLLRILAIKKTPKATASLRCWLCLGRLHLRSIRNVLLVPLKEHHPTSTGTSIIAEFSRSFREE